MKIKNILILLIIFSFSCNKSPKTESLAAKNPPDSTAITNLKFENFDFEKFKIKKGQIGDIKIGMEISEAETKLSNLTKEEAEAYDFGYDGGGKAYIYSFKNKPVIAIIPKRESTEILAIIALNNKLKTDNGLNPNSSVKEIQKKYPEIEVYQNIMMNWEFIHDQKDNLDFIFTTKENNKIGKYTELEAPTKPIRSEIKMNWITIK
jgi:hypothetical protein